MWRAGAEMRRTLGAFRAGYLAGYGARLTSEHAAFLAWAGDVMRRDLGERYSAAELRHLERWPRIWRAGGWASPVGRMVAPESAVWRMPG